MRVKVLIFGADGKRSVMPFEAEDLPSATIALRASLTSQGLTVGGVEFSPMLNGLVVHADTVPTKV